MPNPTSPETASSRSALASRSSLRESQSQMRSAADVTVGEAPPLAAFGSVRPGPVSWVFGALALLLLALLECCVWWRLAPSAVRPASSALQEFSAERAALVEGRLLSELVPHPAGSPAQTRVRERLLAELRELGLKPEEQSGIACSYEGTCAELHNVIAVVPGTGQGTELGLVAHYDSAGAGPGAGDDGQGTASLIEIGRALRSAPLAHGVALIFTDGEELGLLGARLFTHEHRLMRELRVVLNLEARGTRGPSLMFQATNGSGWLVRQFAAAPHPVSSSVFGAVYRALPNDTDLTVFAQQGTQGLNFAFLGGVENYHTSRDLPAALDLRSVQQQGDSALAALRKLDRHRLERAGADAVYFDLASWLLITLPVRWMLPAALIALLAFGLTLGRDFARDPSYGGKLGRAALALGLAWAVPVALAAALGRVLALLGALPSASIAQPLPVLVGLASLVFGGQALALWISRSSEQRRALADVTWIAWLALGTALSLALPEASYVAVLPALCAAALRLLIGPSSSPRAGARACLCAALIASLLWLPLLTLLPSVFGLASPALLAIALCIASSPFAPVFGGLLGGRRSALVLCLGGVAALLCQLAWSPYSARVPQRLSLLFEQDADGVGRWLADASGGRLPRALFAAAAFTPVPAHPHPWPAYGQTLTYAASANLPPIATYAPKLVRSGRQGLRLDLQAPPALWGLGVRLHGARLEQARWRGRTIQPDGDADGERFLLVPGVDRTISLELDFSGPVPSELDVVAIEPGLPEAGRSLLEARGERAVPSGYGDFTILSLPARVPD